MDQVTPDDDAAPDDDQLRRRTALKLLLGSATATAAVNAPGIVGVARLGGYAAALSACTDPTPTYTHSRTPTGIEPTPGDGWQQGSGLLGVYASLDPPYTIAGPVHFVEADPPAGTYPNATTPDLGTAMYTSTGFTLAGGRTYTISFNYQWRDHNTHVARQRLEAQLATSASGPWTTHFTFTTTIGTGATRDITSAVIPASFIFTPPAPPGGPSLATYFFRYRHSFDGVIGSASNQRSNDIAVQAPTFSCV